MEEYMLVYPTIDYKEDAKKFLDEVNGVDVGLSWQHAGMSGLDEAKVYEDWVKEKDNEKNGIDLKEGYVPAYTFFLINKNNPSKILGMINIRHKLNDYLLNYGGHIGYIIRPDERKKGLGNIQLKLALEECRKLGIDKVLITCSDQNVASQKTIEHFSGVLENKLENGNEIIRRYWINLNR